MRQEISIWLLVFSSLLGQPIWKEGDESNIQKALPLPFFNEGFNRVVMISGEERAYLAAIGNGFVTWMDNGSIQLSVNYYCSKTRDCMAHFRLNNSKNMLNIKCYGTRRLIPTQQPTRYMATVLLTPLQKAGFAIVAFDLLVVHNLKLEGKATGQYVVHMQPPNKRYLIHNCNFKVKAYPRVNMLVFHVDPRPFMPNGLQWQKFIIHKRISLETPPAKNYVNVPIIIMTRSPFIFIKINFYYFKDVTFELSENGKIQLKGTTVSCFLTDDITSILIYSIPALLRRRIYVLESIAGQDSSTYLWKFAEEVNEGRMKHQIQLFPIFSLLFFH